MRWSRLLLMISSQRLVVLLLLHRVHKIYLADGRGENRLGSKARLVCSSTVLGPVRMYLSSS